jgi:hypothetical protein
MFPLSELWLWLQGHRTLPPLKPAPIDKLIAVEEPEEPPFQKFAGPGAIPESRNGVYRLYGNPGSGKVDRKWQRKHMVMARDLPGTWNKGKGRLYCHKLTEERLREALRRCQVLGVLGYIERLGCFNFRHQRHDPSRPLSYHSWGIAVDINPKDNSPKRFGIRMEPKPFSDVWWDYWPKGVPPELVEAFESTGWTWGGRWSRFVDPMHFQLVG